MPPKRTSRSNIKRSAPRKRRMVARGASVESVPAMRALRGRLVNSDEKRELILAHAAMRQPHDPVQMMSLWAGVTVAFLVVIGGWAWAFAPTAFGTSRVFKSDLDATAGRLAEVGKTASQAADVHQALDHLAASLAPAAIEADATSTRADLFQPSSASTTSPTTTSPISPPYGTPHP